MFRTRNNGQPTRDKAADIARETQAARSQLSPEARREVEMAEKAGKEHDRASNVLYILHLHDHGEGKTKDSMIQLPMNSLFL